MIDIIVIINWCQFLQVSLDSSNIIYFEKNNTAENDDQRRGIASLFGSKIKRFKRNNYSKDDNIALRVENTNFKLCEGKNRQSVPACKYIKRSCNNDPTIEVSNNAFTELCEY